MRVVLGVYIESERGRSEEKRREKKKGWFEM